MVSKIGFVVLQNAEGRRQGEIPGFVASCGEVYASGRGASSSC